MKILLTILCFLSLQLQAQTFSSTLNPTGDPIGGDVGFRAIYLPSKCHYVVRTKAQLLSAISVATYGQIVYVYDTCKIDLSDTVIVIPKGVTLASGRGKGTLNGALLYSNSYWPENVFRPMITTGGDSVTITGLRLRGPSPDILDHDTRRGFANAIRSRHSDMTVSNCEIWAWNKWAIWLYYSKNAWIHHNYIHHTTLAGYGYLVWCGGMGNEKGSFALIEGNLFETGRHAIASSGHLNSWEARYNVFMRRQLYVNLDRHGQGRTGYGGHSISVHHNLFFTYQQHYGFAEPADSAGTIDVYENYFARDSISAGTIGYLAHINNTSNKRVTVRDNHYSKQGQVLPLAVITTNVVEGTVPLKVSFDARSSSDSEGGIIKRYMWRFGDGDYRGNENRSAKTSYTFKTPGIYTVTLVVFNNLGIPSDVATTTITVKPKSTTRKYVLSAWIKDSYPDTLSGIYEKQILVDDSVVWRDDVSGNEDWTHAVVDISDFGNVGSQHRIAVRLYSKRGLTNYLQEICELFMWVDDVHVFNSSMYANSFESAKAYPPWNQKFNIPPGAPGISTAVTSEERRSGEFSFRIRFAYSGMIVPGQWGEVYQYVIFK